MSVQIKLYIEEMKNMYKKIMEKTKLTLNDVSFLIAYKKTIDNSIEIPIVKVIYE